MKLCPACINEFLVVHKPDDLCDEITTLCPEPDLKNFRNCSLHKHLSLVKEVRKAFKAVKVFYDMVMALEPHESLPSQKIHTGSRRVN